VILTLETGPLGHLQQCPTKIINENTVAGTFAHGAEVVMCAIHNYVCPNYRKSIALLNTESFWPKFKANFPKAVCSC
jgi:hypothetical protein